MYIFHWLLLHSDRKNRRRSRLIRKRRPFHIYRCRQTLKSPGNTCNGQKHRINTSRTQERNFRHWLIAYLFNFNKCIHSPRCWRQNLLYKRISRSLASRERHRCLHNASCSTKVNNYQHTDTSSNSRSVWNAGPNRSNKRQNLRWTLPQLYNDNSRL